MLFPKSFSATSCLGLLSLPQQGPWEVTAWLCCPRLHWPARLQVLPQEPLPTSVPQDSEGTTCGEDSWLLLLPMDLQKAPGSPPHPTLRAHPVLNTESQPWLLRLSGQLYQHLLT